MLARIIGDKLKDRLGQPVVVEDRPAAGGTAATDFVAKSPPDGYTMVMSFNGPLAFATAPVLEAAVRSAEGPRAGHHHFEPAERAGGQRRAAGQVGEGAGQYAKANPGKLNYASVGNGSSSQLTMELLKSIAGIDIVHVPFNGSPPAVTATSRARRR